MIQAESIADSDLEDGELRKMLASPLCLQNREDCASSRMPIATVKPAALLQDRGATAKSVPTDSRKGLMSSSSQEPIAPGKPAFWYGWALEASTSETWFLHRGFLYQARFHALTDRMPVH